MLKSFTPGKVWTDEQGFRIQAHGGSIFYENGTYYWYGENKEKTLPGTRIWHYGVKMYSSKDLYNWKDEGIILQPVLSGFLKPQADYGPPAYRIQPKNPKIRNVDEACGHRTRTG